MPLDAQEDNAARDREDMPPNESEDSGSGLPPVVAPAQPPIPQQPSAEDSQKWWKDRKFILESLGLAVLCAYTWFACLQWLQIRYTNKLTARALEDNGISLSQTLGKMQGEVDAMNRLVDKAGIQADKLDASVQQASRLATDTEKANANVIDADRPWMGMGLDVTPLEVDKIPVAHMLVVNSGRRPAQVDIGHMQANFFQSGFPANPPYYSTPTTRSKNFIVPGSSLAMTMNVFQGNLSRPDLDLLNSGKTFLYIYADVVYRDVKDGSSHFTHGCWRYSPKTVVQDAGFVTCTEYNEAN